jgi:(1->4)-alpha-D-glucan 1-alpha-D-glucosylmutase
MSTTDPAGAEQAELVESVLAEALRRAARPFPESTYRLQFHAGFTFRDACAVVPYLRDLGVTHLYASPYLKARPGSTHGYDITDHRVLNPEIGGPEDYAAMVGALRQAGMGQVLDMVPNHMGVACNDNPWWNDVLENGPASAYASYFDIAWQAPPRRELQNRLLLPVLGDLYAKVLESGQLRLVYDDGAFFVTYYERRFPLDPCSYAAVLGHRADELQKELGPDHPAASEYQSILTAVGHLPGSTETDPPRVAERLREKEVVKRRLQALVKSSPQVYEFLEVTLRAFNGKPGEPHSFDLLDDLLDRQPYRLSFWRVAIDEINYRRFFDVNDLAALSMEREDVFAASHELVFRLLAGGELDGLRIDHPDGLFDPRQYLDRLQHAYLLACARAAFAADPRCKDRDFADLEGAFRARTAAVLASHAPSPKGGGPHRWPLYVVVEKILAASEPLPADWPVHGTSGYDFLNAANALFVNPHAGAAFTRLYAATADVDDSFAALVYEKKNLILQVSLASELYTLAHQLDRLAQKHRASRDFTLNSLQFALRAVIACFPVYRSYITAEGVRAEDRMYVEAAVRLARFRNPSLSASLFRFIRDMLLQDYPETASEQDRHDQARFAGKFQQVTAPVTAKGVEDTAFYVYNRLLSLNEVGGDPARFGSPPEALHRYLQARQARWPYALSPLSTHDTKRSEDVRARINVLSEIPDEWRDAVDRWRALNEPHRHDVEDARAPDANEEYLIYQTLVGAWPLEDAGPEAHADFVQRVQAFLVKALHEAKVHSSWTNPDTAYDEAVVRFAGRILDPDAGKDFLADFRPFQQRVSALGLFNSLAQTLLRLTAPGAPDTYQGTELWDFSLVDPDNRRPVDYGRRKQLLSELQTRAAGAGEDRRGLARELLAGRADGRVKLLVVWQGLCCRRDRPGLFSEGEYLPGEAAGARREQAFGFARRHGDHLAVVVVPRLLAGLPLDDGLPLGPTTWEDARLVLPIDPRVRLRNVFTGETLAPGEQDGKAVLPLAEALAHFPVGLFVVDR